MTTEDEIAERMVALRPALLRYFERSIGKVSEAEDMAQDVYVRLLGRGRLDTYEGFTAYMFQVAESVLRDRNRRRAVRDSDRHVPLEPEATDLQSSDPERNIMARDELRSTSIILAQLPERARAVFVLRRIDGASFAEISVRLGISVSTAEKHMLKVSRHLLAAMRANA